jgi:transcription elongation factor S-II
MLFCQVGKRLRPLTKHPHSGIQAVAADLFGYWKKVVLEESGKKNGGSENERSSDSSGKVEKVRPMKVEKNSASASTKVEMWMLGVRSLTMSKLRRPLAMVPELNL